MIFFFFYLNFLFKNKVIGFSIFIWAIFNDNGQMAPLMQNHFYFSVDVLEHDIEFKLVLQMNHL